MEDNIIISNELYEQLILNAYISTGFLSINKQLIKEYGVDGACIIGNYLDKHQYFKHNNHNFNGWFYLTFEDQKTEMNISFYTLKKWKDYFVQKGILQTKTNGMPPKLYYKIDFKKFFFDGKTIGEATTYPTFSGGMKSEIQNNDNQEFTKDTCPESQQNPYPTFSGGQYPTFSGGIYITCIENKDNTILCANDPKINQNQFNDFWDIYPKKVDKGKALATWNKLCTQKNKTDVRPKWTEVRKAIHYQKKSERWQVKEYIPNPTTWLNNYMWLTDPKDLVIFNFDKQVDNTPKDKYGKPIPLKIRDRNRDWFWDDDLKAYYDADNRKYEKI